MKKLFLSLLALTVMLSAVACGGEVETDLNSDLGGDVSVGESVDNVENEPSDEENAEEVYEEPDEEEPEIEEPVIEEPVVEPIEESEEEPVEAVVEVDYGFEKLSTFGLPEPSFPYSLRCYEENSIGFDYELEMSKLRVKFIFDYDCDLETAYNYMKECRAAGWEDYIPESIPTLIGGDSFWFTPEKDGYKVNITWDNEGDHYIWVTDSSLECHWDSDLRAYVIEGIGEYKDYGHYGQ